MSLVMIIFYFYSSNEIGLLSLFTEEKLRCENGKDFNDDSHEITGSILGFSRCGPPSGSGSGSVLGESFNLPETWFFLLWNRSLS